MIHCQGMDRELFDRLEQTVGKEGPEAALDFLISTARGQKNYPLLFEARLMRKRHELGLPFLFSGNISDLPPEHQPVYEAAMAEAAREAGVLFLADGNIERAWPYFRAIGDPAPVADAIEHTQSLGDNSHLLEIALQDGVNPRRGFELLLERHGICRAMEFATQCTDREARAMFLRMLVRAIYADLATHLREAIGGGVPVQATITELIANRDWLFEGARFYTENSHLASMIQASPELEDAESRRLALELAEYALHLDPMHHFPGTAPFENLYEDHTWYLRALLGQDVDSAVAHFRGKVAAQIPGAAEVLTGVLARIGRYDEAIQVSLERLGGRGFGCPSAIELCRMAGDYRRLAELARQQGDALVFAAAVIQTSLTPQR